MKALERISTNKGLLPLAICETLYDNAWNLDDEMKEIWDDVLITPSLPVIIGPAPNIMGKMNESIYIYDGYVYKYFEDSIRCSQRVARSIMFAGRCPMLCKRTDHWYSYRYIAGEILTNNVHRLTDYLDWMEIHCWSKLCKENWSPWMREKFLRSFYVSKTTNRVKKYGGSKLLQHVLWKKILANMKLTKLWHGDCSFENIICLPNGAFCIIDWRENTYGDVYYDLAKLIKSIYFKHDTLDANGNFEGHDVKALINILESWCADYNYDWEVVNLLSGVAILAMAGSHSGAFGDNLFKLGEHVLSDALD